MRGLTNHFAIALAWVCLLTPSPALFGENASPSQHNASNAGNSRPNPQAPSPYSSVPRGFDTLLKFAGTNMGGGCVATLVARIPLAGGACRVAFMTAGHCIQNTTALEVMELTIPGIGPLRVANKPGRLVHFHSDAPVSERTVRYEKRRPNGELVGLEDHELPGGSDFALMHLDLPDCQKNLGYERPAKLAECGSDGRVLLNESEGLTFQKRHSPEGDKRDPNKFNYGGGAHLRLTNMRKFFGRIFPRLDVRGSAGVQFREGDSGAPVWNDRGEMVGVAASSTVENEDLLFDPKAICEAKNQLNKWGMWPPVPDSGSSAPETKPAQVAAQAIADTRAPSGVPVSTSALPIATNAAAPEIRIDQDAAGKKRLVWQTAVRSAEPIFGRKNQEGSTDWLFKNSAGQWEKLPPAAHAKLAEFYRPFAETRARFEQAFGNANERSLVEGFLKPQWASRPLDSFASIAQPTAGAQPPAVVQPSVQRPGPGPNVGPIVANVGAAPAAGAFVQTPVSSAEAQAARQIVHQYENEMRYPTSGNKRYRMGRDFPGTFTDIPVGGTGKVIVGYFGNKNAAFESKFQDSAPFVEFRRYSDKSREYQIDPGVFVVDGLGRKVTHSDNVSNAAAQAASVRTEVARLRNYLAAKAKLQAPAPAVSAANTPKIPQAPKAQTQAAPPAAQSSHSRGLSSTEGIASASARSGQPIDHSGYGLGSCIQCHTAGGVAPVFPNFVSQPEQWDQLLGRGDLKAQKWLKSFRDNVLGGEMLSKAGLTAHEGQGLALSKSIEALSAKHLSSTTRAASPVTQRSPQAWLIDPNKQAEYRSILASAAFKDPSLRAELQDFDVIWDKVGNPEWHWAAAKGSAGRGGARPVGASEAATSLLQRLFKKKRTGEEHWLEPFNKGFSSDENTVGLKSFSLMRLPRDANGNPIKCAHGFETKTGTLSQQNPNRTTSVSIPDELPSFWASCPVGTTVYEVQYNTSLGRPVILDVFSRTKDADSVSAVPSPNAFRPDSSPEAILSWIQRQTDTSNPDYAVLKNAVQNPQRDQVAAQINEGGRLGQPFIVGGQRSSTIAGSKSVIPRGAVSPQTLSRMYSELPLTSALGNQGWQLEAQDLFANSHRGIAVNTQNCLNCHRQAGESFRDVFKASGLGDSNTYRYGNAPGYDSILGAPFFSNQALNGFNRLRVDTTMRPELAPYFEPYNPARHPSSAYRRTEAYPVTNQPLRSGRQY